MTSFRVCLNLYRHLPVTKPETSPVEQVPRFHHRPPHKSPRFPSYPQPFLYLFNLLPISLLLRESPRNAFDDLRHRESPRNSTNQLRIICVSSPLTTTRSENRTATTSPEIVLSPTMVTEAEVGVQYRHCVPKEPAVVHQIEVASSQILHEVRVADSVPTEFTRVDSVLSCSENLKDAAMDSSKSKYLPCIRSGSHADIGCRTSMEDEHIRIDDLSARLDSSNFCIPSAFYAVFDGHGGPAAAAYIKRNVMRLLFEDILLPEVSEIDDSFLKQLEDSHREAYLQADLALANEPSVSSSCGTTALTALVLGRHLLVANAGDCRAVLCRRGTAIEMSQDHRPSYVPERKRVEESGGFILDGYLSGYLSITRALGDWDVKLPLGFDSPLTAEPDFQWATLTEEDEFLIIACDGIWDVMSSQYAVSLIRRGLRRHNDPQQCARELVMDALRLNTSDNVTVIIVCLSSPEPLPPLRRRLRCCNLSEEA